MNEAQPTIEVVQLTPELAQEFLSCNTDNYRNVGGGHVSNLAAAMRRGEFDSVIPSNDAIAFAKDGTMTNGQHRCLAVVRSGVTIPVIVMRGGSVDTADVMDQGAKRSTATVLARHGYSNAAALAGTVRSYNGLMGGSYASSSLTSLQVLDFVKEHHDGLRIAISYGKRAESIGLPRSLGAAFHFAIGQTSMESANEFFSRLVDGVGLYPGNPIHTIRARALKHLGSSNRLDRTYFAAILIKAWNAWYDHRDLRVLKWRGAQNPNEPFPTILSERALVQV